MHFQMKKRMPFPLLGTECEIDRRPAERRGFQSDHRPLVERRLDITLVSLGWAAVMRGLEVLRADLSCRTLA